MHTISISESADKSFDLLSFHFPGEPAAAVVLPRESTHIGLANALRQLAGVLDARDRPFRSLEEAQAFGRSIEGGRA